MDVSRSNQYAVQSTAAPKRVNQTQQREPTPVPQDQPKKLAEFNARPTVNSQGQTTGRLLNVKA